MKNTIFIFAFLFSTLAFAQKKYTAEEVNINKVVDGTLFVPNKNAPHPLVIIIQGSGPTDRNGNQPNMNNNSLKYLAEGLSEKGIASFRYDKRLVKQAKQGRLKEEDIRFDDFIEDANLILKKYEDDPRFSKIIVLGHSQGSLVGMVAAQQGADAFISIAGAGQEIDDVIVDQLQRQAPALADEARDSFDDLRVNGVAKNYGEGLASIFRPSIQPFMASWMEYNPQKEIAKLDIPVLILNGDQDVQVDQEEAKLLHRAKPQAEFYLIEGMNHVLKEIEDGDTIDNGKSYNEPKRPIVKELVDKITTFITDLD